MIYIRAGILVRGFIAVLAAVLTDAKKKKKLISQLCVKLLLAAKDLLVAQK